MYNLPNLHLPVLDLSKASQKVEKTTNMTDLRSELRLHVKTAVMWIKIFTSCIWLVDFAHTEKHWQNPHMRQRQQLEGFIPTNLGTTSKPFDNSLNESYVGSAVETQYSINANFSQT